MISNLNVETNELEDEIIRLNGELATAEMRIVELEERIEMIDTLTVLSCADGTWDYDDYFRGFANGMLLAQAVLVNGPYNPFGAPSRYKIEDRQEDYIL